MSNKASDRAAMIDQIAKTSIESTIKDIEEEGGDAQAFKAILDESGEDKGEETVAGQEESTETAQADPELDAAQKEIQESFADPSAKVRAVIDGEERIATVEEMTRAYQKHAAADRRLAEATRLLREAEQAKQQATSVTERKQADADVESAKASLKEQMAASVKNFTDSLYEGEVDKAVQTLTAAFENVVEKAFEGRASATPSVDDIAAQVTQQLSVKEALAQGKRDYPSIFADLDLAELTDKHVTRLMSDPEHPLSEPEAIVKACEAVASKFKLDKFAEAGRTDPATTRRTEKVERKQTISTIPSAGARAATTPSVDPDSSEGRISVIEELRKARGQA